MNHLGGGEAFEFEDWSRRLSFHFGPLFIGFGTSLALLHMATLYGELQLIWKFGKLVLRKAVVCLILVSFVQSSIYAAEEDSAPKKKQTCLTTFKQIIVGSLIGGLISMPIVLSIDHYRDQKQATTSKETLEQEIARHENARERAKNEFRNKFVITPIERERLSKIQNNIAIDFQQADKSLREDSSRLLAFGNFYFIKNDEGPFVVLGTHWKVTRTATKDLHEQRVDTYRVEGAAYVKEVEVTTFDVASRNPNIIPEGHYLELRAEVGKPSGIHAVLFGNPKKLADLERNYGFPSLQSNVEHPMFPPERLIENAWYRQSPPFKGKWFEEIYPVAQSNSDVVVAVLDTGLDLYHEEIWKRLYSNPGENRKDSNGFALEQDGVDSDGNGYIDDAFGWDFTMDHYGPFPFDKSNAEGASTHGTQVATFIGRDSKKIRILGLRVFHGTEEAKSEDWYDSLSAFTEAVNYIEKLNLAAKESHRPLIRVVNVSHRMADSLSQILLQKVIRIHPELLFVVSAGNNPKTVNWLATVKEPNVISVAALDSKNDDLADWSSRGEVDIAAPGSDVEAYATEGWMKVEGTSFAAPYVSDVAAKTLLVDPSLTPAQEKQMILSLAQKSDKLKAKVRTGAKIDPDAVFNAAKARATSKSIAH